MKVWTAAPLMPATIKNKWLPMNWLASNDIVMQVVSDDEPPVLRDDFDEIIIGLDCLKTGINLEVSHGAWQYLNYHKHPETAALLYAQVARRINELRPELDFFFYVLPHGMGNLQKDPEGYGVKVMEREVAFRAASQYMKTVAFTGYWKKGVTWDEWKQRQEMSIAMARTVHKKTPVAFVWDGAGGWKKGHSYSNMKAILNFFKARDVDVVYWDYWASAYQKKIKWSTQLALWQFTL